MADVQKAKVEARNEAVSYAMTILFTVLLDKEGHSQEDLRRIWDEVNALSDGIVKGYVSLNDLRNVLRKEYDILV